MRNLISQASDGTCVCLGVSSWLFRNRLKISPLVWIMAPNDVLGSSNGNQQDESCSTLEGEGRAAGGGVAGRSGALGKLDVAQACYPNGSASRAALPAASTCGFAEPVLPGTGFAGRARQAQENQHRQYRDTDINNHQCPRRSRTAPTTRPLCPRTPSAQMEPGSHSFRYCRLVLGFQARRFKFSQVP